MYYNANYVLCILFLIATISVVSAVYINSTSVRVTWTPLNLPVVDHYTVHYSSIVNGGSGRRRRQTDSGSVTFLASVSSGVVSGLLGGQQYQFSVSVTLSVGGQTYTGEPGTPLKLSTVDEPLSTVTGVCMHVVYVVCIIELCMCSGYLPGLHTHNYLVYFTKLQFHRLYVYVF